MSTERYCQTQFETGKLSAARDFDSRTSRFASSGSPDPQHSHHGSISNNGGVPAKLLNRHWIITDANGKIQEVRGEGVVGEQPYLRPGEAFRYTSGAVIQTPVGSMEGEYEMIADNGECFLAPIAPFSLSMPRAVH